MLRSAATKTMFLILALSLVLVGFSIGTSVFSTRAETEWDISFAPPASAIDQQELINALTPGEQILAKVYNAVSPSVVSINVSSNLGQSGGSGFVLDKQGYIATNYHVVEGAQDVEVNFLDGTITRAEIVGLDPDSDLAVISVDLPEDRLFPVQFGSSRDLIVGQSVVAIGSPFGQRWTMTSGIVSAVERTVPSLNQDFSIGGVIQTDAPINPGNSGGPLLNLEGEVVGVNAQIRTETGSNSGIGFAIPSDLVQRVLPELIQNGRVSYSYLGIGMAPITLDEIEDLGLPNNMRGVIVSQALPNGPAGEAGVRGATVTQNSIDFTTADIIIAINGEQVIGTESLVGYLARNTSPGDTITLTVLRQGQRLDIPVTLEARPSR